MYLIAIFVSTFLIFSVIAHIWSIFFYVLYFQRGVRSINTLSWLSDTHSHTRVRINIYIYFYIDIYIYVYYNHLHHIIASHRPRAHSRLSPNKEQTTNTISRVYLQTCERESVNVSNQTQGEMENVSNVLTVFYFSFTYLNVLVNSKTEINVKINYSVILGRSNDTILTAIIIDVIEEWLMN